MGRKRSGRCGNAGKGENHVDLGIFDGNAEKADQHTSHGITELIRPPTLDVAVP